MNKRQRPNRECWMALYQAVLQEQDPKETPGRVIDARFAVVERALTLVCESRSNDSELDLLVNIAGVLDDLAVHTPMERPASAFRTLTGSMNNQNDQSVSFGLDALDSKSNRLARDIQDIL